MELSVFIQAELWTQVYKIVQAHVQGSDSWNQRSLDGGY